MHTWVDSAERTWVEFRLTVDCKDEDGFNLPAEKVTVSAEPTTGEVEVILTDFVDTRLEPIRRKGLEKRFKKLFSQKVQ